MNIEQQVISLDLAKRLKEFGIKQDSLFYYLNIDGEGKYYIYYEEVLPEDFEYEGDPVSAFTVAELGEMLPKAIQIKTEEEEKKIFSYFRLVTGRSLIFDEDKPCEFWSVNYICDTTNEFRNWLFDPLLTKAIYDKSEADARAKMLIYLIENGLMKSD